MKISRTVSFGMGAVMTLVIGSGTAYAATGGKFILGKSNSATATSTLTNTRGTALSLSSKAGTPSLKVNRTTKVANLNSDLLDGLDQSKFALAAGQTSTLEFSGELFDADDPADGIVDFIAAFATCPAGTKLTGGGGLDFTSGGTLWLTAPLPGNTWMVASTQTTFTQENADLVFADAQCYNPRGAVSGASFRTAGPSAKTMAAARAILARKAH